MVFSASKTNFTRSYKTLRRCIFVLLLCGFLQVIGWTLFTVAAWSETHAYRGVYDGILYYLRWPLTTLIFLAWVIVGIACLPSRKISKTLWLSSAIFASALTSIPGVFWTFVQIVQLITGSALPAVTDVTQRIFSPLYAASPWIDIASGIVLCIVLIRVTTHKGRLRWLGILYAVFFAMPFLSDWVLTLVFDPAPSQAYLSRVDSHYRAMYVVGIIQYAANTALFAWILKDLRWLVVTPPEICAACHYKLSGITNDKCPECGTAFDHEQS